MNFNCVFDTFSEFDFCKISMHFMSEAIYKWILNVLYLCFQQHTQDTVQGTDFDPLLI